MSKELRFSCIAALTRSRAAATVRSRSCTPSITASCVITVASVTGAGVSTGSADAFGSGVGDASGARLQPLQFPASRIDVTRTITAKSRKPAAKNSSRRVFFRLRLRFCGGREPPEPPRVPEDAVFADVERLCGLREDVPVRVCVPREDALAARACSPCCAAAPALRSLAKRSVPFAAAKGSSALRFGKEDAVRRAFQSRAGAASVFGCGRTMPTVAESVMIPYYSKVDSDSQ